MSDIDQFQDIQDAASDGLGEGEPTGSLSDIQSYIEGQLSTIAQFYTDAGELPVDALPRANGVFNDYTDALDYLMGGGLVAHGANEGDYVALGFVHILRHVNANDGRVEYLVYIQDTSP